MFSDPNKDYNLGSPSSICILNDKRKNEIVNVYQIKYKCCTLYVTFHDS